MTHPMETIRAIIPAEENSHILAETVPKELISLIQEQETLVIPGVGLAETLDSQDHNKVVAKDTQGGPMAQITETTI